MKPEFPVRRRGFTLIELSIAIMLGIATGSMVLTLFNQQLVFLDLYHRQNFLTEEAPVISNHVSKLVGKADRFRLYGSIGDVRNNGTPWKPGDAAAKAVVLNFRQPNGSMRASILAFEDRGIGAQLYFYVVPANGVLGSPQWAVTSQPKDVGFVVDQGVLRMTLTGPNDEQIIYSGSMQQ